MKSDIELLIQHDNKIYVPVVQEDIIWSTERKGTPGMLEFKIICDLDFNVSEGDAVRFRVNNCNIFYGFIFKLEHDKNRIISITAYDQLRYLKNKDTYVYENKTASELIKMIADDFKLQCGNIDDTNFKIESRIESNISLFDIIQNALDITLQNKKQLYVLYDDFGKLTLKSLDNTRVNFLINENSAENYNYSSSIDSETYNKVKLTYDNEKTGLRDVYIAKDSHNINKWGVLQYFEVLNDNINGKSKADALLKLYNTKTQNLTVKNILGDNHIRAGSIIVVFMDLGSIKVKNMMLVEKCKHKYRESEHLMDLTLRGGESIA